MSLLADTPPGTRRQVELHVGLLPSGTPIRIRAHVVRAVEPGPTALLLGGVHGDEINGVEIVRRLICGDLPDRLARGGLIAIPLLNVFGFLNYARDVPDGKDVNRSFPGSARGSLASRVAHVLTTRVLPEVDFGVDFHTGGRCVYNWPQVRYDPADARAAQLAAHFAAPVSLASRTIPRSLRRTASRLGRPVLVYEGGENLRLNPECIAEAVAGTERLLAAEGLLEASRRLVPADPSSRQVFGESRWVRAPRAGLFEAARQSGVAVRAGETLGHIRDPYGNEEQAVRCPRDGFIVGHDNSPVVNQGDALFHLAW